MKNVSLFSALFAIVLVTSCNKNPEEQQSEAIIKNKPSVLVNEKEEKTEQKSSNSYAFVPGPERNENSAIQFPHRSLKPPVDNILQTPKSGTDFVKAEANNSGNIYDIFKSFEKPFQSFTFSSQKDTVLIGLEGTTLKVKANCFIAENTNQTVAGPIEIKLVEYYSFSDMLLANLSTKSGNELIETGGMIYLEAYSGSEKLKLKSGRQLEIGFPYKEPKEGMQLFNGNWKSDVIEWTPADSGKFSILEVVDEMPQFPGGYSALQNFLSAQLKYPTKAQRKGIQGTVILSLVVDTTGSLGDITILRSVAPDIDAEAIRVASQMPKWIPGKVKGQNVPTRFTLPFRFLIDGVIDRNSSLFQSGNKIKDKEFARNFEKINNDSLQSSNINSMSLYLLSTSNLGWINCDRFYNKSPKINFAIRSNDASQQDVKIIFHKIKSVLPGVALNDKTIFQNVPKNEKITILALKKVDNKPYLAIRETNTSEVLQTELVYSEITMEILKQEMQKLNKIH